MSVSPYGLNFSYGSRSGGVSSYYRPTNSIRYGIGINQFSTGYVPLYRSTYYGSNLNGSYYGADYPPSYALNPAEQAARDQLFNQGNAPGYVPNQTIINDTTTNKPIVNEFYPQISTTAAARSLQRRAELAFKTGDYRDAETLASQATVVEPDNGQMMLFAAQASFANGNFSQSATFLKKGTENLPREKWNSVVKNYKEFYGRNDYVSQTNRLTQHLASNPTDANAFAVRGYHYGSLGYIEAATLDFQSALAVDPNHELSQRLLPVLGTIPQPVSEEVEAPIPTATVIPDERMIYLVPQADVDIRPQDIPVTGTIDSLESETGSSILLQGPIK